MKRTVTLFVLLASLTLLPGCGNSDRDKDKNKGLDIPRPAVPKEKT